eukprot:9062406-Pyramimonas_sp.AAC.1
MKKVAHSGPIDAALGWAARKGIMLAGRRTSSHPDSPAGGAPPGLRLRLCAAAAGLNAPAPIAG